MAPTLEGDWRQDGYLIARGLYTAERVSQLLEVAESCRHQWMHEKNPEWGGVGSPQPVGSPRPTAEQLSRQRSMRHLNHPGYFGAEGAKSPAFKTLMEAIADPQVQELAEGVLGCPPLFRSTTLFFNPTGDAREGNWHRDSQFTIPDEHMEKAFLTQLKSSGLITRSAGIQMQIALVPNEDVEFVSGSHSRWDTNEEYHVRMADEQSHNTEPISTAVRMSLRPGDAVLFNSWGLHRGRYYADHPRRTLMWTFTPSDMPFFDYFSDQPWMLEPGHLSALNEYTQRFFRRFIDAYGDQIRGVSPDRMSTDEQTWEQHVRPHHVTGRRYEPQFQQMARTLERLGKDSGVVGELARL